MTVEKLSETTVLVSLERAEMTSRGLDLNSSDAEGVRMALAEVLRRVGEELGRDYSGKSCLVEALPGGGSCLLVITVRGAKRRRYYRVKRAGRREYCLFANADDMLDCIAACGGLGCEILAYGRGYVLLPRLPLTERQRGLLNEYGRAGELSGIAEARVREYGKRMFVKSGRTRGKLGASSIKSGFRSEKTPHS